MSLPRIGKRPNVAPRTVDWTVSKDPQRFLEMLEKGVKRSVIHRAERKEVNADDKTATFIVNSNMDDRDREIVLPQAVIQSRDIYMMNPVFLWGHRHRGNPEDILGTCMGAELVENDTKIEAKFQYDVEIHQQADTVFKQVQKGTVRAVSIGFIPLEWVTAWDGDEMIERLPAYAAEALKSGRVWVVYTKVEWVETSQVPIGSNRQALAASLGERSMEEDVLCRLYEKLTGEKISEPETEADQVEQVQAQEKEADDNVEKSNPEPEEAKAERPGATKEPELPGSSEDENPETEAPGEKGLEERLAAAETELAELKTAMAEIRPMVKELLTAHIKTALSS